MVLFEWNEAKAARNLKDHGLDFEDASFVFDDPFRITEEDSVVGGEHRWRTVGMALGTVVLLVVHLEREDTPDTLIRIISARKATPRKKRPYEQSRKKEAR